MSKPGAPPPYDGSQPPPGPYPGQPPNPAMYGQMGNPIPPGYGPPPATVVVQQPTVVTMFRETPVHTRCPSCGADIITATFYETGTMTWVVALILCFFFGGLLCCLIPFCVDSCKDVVHQCPNCQTQISRFNQM